MRQMLMCLSSSQSLVITQITSAGMSRASSSTKGKPGRESMMRTGITEDLLAIYSISARLEGKQNEQKKHPFYFEASCTSDDRMKMLKLDKKIAVQQGPTQF